MWHRLAHRVGRFVASADRRRGQVSQRLEHKNSDSPMVAVMIREHCARVGIPIQDKQVQASAQRDTNKRVGTKAKK